MVVGGAGGGGGRGGGGGDVGDEGAQLGQDVPELVDGGELLDVGLEEGLGGRVVEGVDVGVDVAADVLEGEDEAVGRGKGGVSGGFGCEGWGGGGSGKVVGFGGMVFVRLTRRCSAR